MFIVAYILFGLGVALLIGALIAYFKLGVKDAYNFTKNRRVAGGKGGSSHVKPRKMKTDYSGKRTTPPKLEIKENDKPNDSSTDMLSDDDSESETDLLQEESEMPTGLLDEESEQPTGILEEESEKPTGILVEESEKPTGILEEGSEKPTSALTNIPEKPKHAVKKPVVVKKQLTKSENISFKFEIIKDEVVIHTDELIA